MGSADSSTSKRIKKVLILGDNFPATPIIHTLSHSNRYDIHIAHPHTPTTPHHPNTTFHKLRINPSSLAPPLREIHPDVVIDTTPGPFETKKALIDCLSSSAVSRLILNEFGHDSLNARLAERLPAYAERAKTIAYLRSPSCNGISWCGIAVGVILDRGLLSGNLGFDLSWRNATMHGSGDEKFAASSESWIGRVVDAVLQRWEEVQGRYVCAAGMVTSGNAVLKSLEAATGERKPWTAERGDVEQCVREAKQRIERGFPDAGMFLMERSVLYDAGLDAVEAFERGDARDVLGLERGEDLDEVVGRVVHEHQDHGGRKEGCGCD